MVCESSHFDDCVTVGQTDFSYAGIPGPRAGTSAGDHRAGAQPHPTLRLAPNHLPPTGCRRAKHITRSTVTRVELQGPVPAFGIHLVETRQDETGVAKVPVSDERVKLFLPLLKAS